MVLHLPSSTGIGFRPLLYDIALSYPTTLNRGPVGGCCSSPCYLHQLYLSGDKVVPTSVHNPSFYLMLTNGQRGQLFMQQCSFLRLSSGSPPHLLPLQLRGDPIRCCFIRDTSASLWMLQQPGSLLSFCDFDAFNTSRGCQGKRRHFALLSFENVEEQVPFLLMAKRATGD